ncbi:unnamed protein product [Pedinophyceae sp. YPF-701]|nr:unnamed protein product [Pedinophyceae sp. YPF-701]
MQDLARRRLPPRLAAVAGQQARRLQIRCDGLNTDDEEPPPDPSSDEDMDCPSESGYEPPVEAERDNHDSDGDSDGDSAACHVTPDEIKELLLDAKRHNDDDDDRDDGAGDDGDGDDRDGAGDDGDSDDRAGPAPGDNVVARARDSRIAWRPLTAPERDLLRQRRDGPAEAAGSEPRGTGHAAAQVSGPPGRARNVTPGDREEGAVERETVASLTESAWACHGFKQYKEPSFGQLNIIRQSPRVEDAGEAECENAKCRFRDGAGRRAPAVRFCRGFDAGPGRWVVPPLSVCKGCARMFDRRIGQFGLPEHGFREVSTGVMLREFCDAYNAWVRDERESYQKEHPGADFSRRVGYAFVRYKHRVRPWQNGRKGFAFELDHVIELVSELEGGYVFGRGVIEDDEAEHLLNFKIPDWQREKEILRLIWLLRREAEQEGGTTTAQDAAPMVFCRNSCDAVPDGGGRYGFAMTHWDRVATSFAHTVGAIMVAHLSADYSKVLCVVSGFSCPPGVRRNAKDVHFYELDLRSSLGRQWVVDPAHHGKARVVARAGAFIKRWSLQRAKTARDMRKLVVKKLRRTRAPSAELVGLDLTVLAISLGGGPAARCTRRCRRATQTSSTCQARPSGSSGASRSDVSARIRASQCGTGTSSSAGRTDRARRAPCTT